MHLLNVTEMTTRRNGAETYHVKIPNRLSRVNPVQKNGQTGINCNKSEVWFFL